MENTNENINIIEPIILLNKETTEITKPTVYDGSKFRVVLPKQKKAFYKLKLFFKGFSKLLFTDIKMLPAPKDI